MTDKKLEFPNLPALLGRPATDGAVSVIIGDPKRIKRSAHVGYVELKAEGLSVMFEEAEWVVAAMELGDRHELRVSAFHLHRAAHEGYSEYTCVLPGGVAFGDPETSVIRKLGQPAATGGGGMSKTLKRPIPHWLRYALGDALLQFQLDENRCVEMVTLQGEGIRHG